MKIGHQILLSAAVLEALALGSLASCSSPEEAARRGPGAAVPSRFASDLERDPIVTVGHGVAILPGGGTVETPTHTFIRDAQHYYIDTLVRQATPDVQAQFDRMSQQQPGTASTELRENHASIRWLLERVKTDDAARLRAINEYLLRKSGDESTPSALGEQQQALLRSTSLSGAGYMEECVNAGVPRPPAWGSSEWTPRGKLEGTLLTQLSDLSTQVYTYQNASGVCFALPRSRFTKDGTTGARKETIALLGVICQSAETSHACFWDAQDLDPPAKGEVYEIDEVFMGGADLTDTCTNCHRGENAFVIHPGTPLDIGDELVIAKGWMRPIVRADWPQNHRPGHDLDIVKPAGTERSCGICHSKAKQRRLPAIDVAYCSAVLLGSVSEKIGTMPAALPEDPPGQTLAQRRPYYATHIAKVNSLCNELQVQKDEADEKARLGIVERADTRFEEGGWPTFAAATPTRALFGDFNDDGRSDYLQVDPRGAVYVSTAGPNGFNASKPWQITLLEGTDAVAAGDFDGDGFEDLLVTPVAGGEVLVAFSNVAFFSDPEGWSAKVEPGSRVVVGDVNNDRLDDLVTVSPGSSARVNVYLSTKHSFELSTTSVVEIGAKEAAVIAGDVDGDYLLDLIFVAPAGGPTTRAIGNRRGFEISRFNAGIPGGLGPQRTHLADVDADGLDDLVVVSENGSVAVSISTGTGFNHAPAWRAPKVGPSVFLTDVNADGRADLVGIDGGSLRVALSRK